jgi:uncharacterized membrane protein (DUF485 family)
MMETITDTGGAIISTLSYYVTDWLVTEFPWLNAIYQQFFGIMQIFGGLRTLELLAVAGLIIGFILSTVFIFTSDSRRHKEP